MLKRSLFKREICEWLVMGGLRAFAPGRPTPTKTASSHRHLCPQAQVSSPINAHSLPPPLSAFMSFGRPGNFTDSFNVSPPEKGSFPLDHDRQSQAPVGHDAGADGGIRSPSPYRCKTTARP